MSRLLLLRVATVPVDALGTLAAPRSAALAREATGLDRELETSASRLAEALHEVAGDRGDARDPPAARLRHAALALRRDLHNGRPLRSDRIEAAAPRLPAPLLRDLRAHEATRARHLDTMAALARAAEEEATAARGALVGIAADAVFEEGLFLASRSLLPKWRATRARPVERWGHDDRHVASKVAAYLARAATKSSPHGVFCATALARADSAPTRVGGAARPLRLDALLAIGETRKVTACLALDPAVRAAVRPRPNPTIRDDGGAVVFWRPATPRRPEDDEALARAKRSPALDAALEEAAEGRATWAELVDRLAARLSVPVGDVERFVGDLVDRGLLSGEIEIPYGSRRPLADLARLVRAEGLTPAWGDSIDAIERRVDAVAGLPAGARPAAIDEIAGALDALPHARPLEHEGLVRIDAASSFTVVLPERIVERLAPPVGAFARLFASMYPEASYRGAVARRFLRKFPAGEDVPLTALYHGVFDFDDTARPAEFPEPVDDGGAGRAAWRRARDVFVAWARETERGEEVRVDAGSLGGLVEPGPGPAWACGVLFQLEGPGGTLPDADRSRIVLDGLFSGTGLALARFWWLLGEGAPLHENPVAAELRRAAAILARDGAIVAEVTYNHGGRTANAGLRPSLLDHEIELPGDRATPGKTVMSLADLVVRWDAGSERFVLRSRRLGCEIVPVVTSGVNPVGIVSFLVEVGRQGLQPLTTFPGFRVDAILRWPRIVCDGTVLFRERWSFGAGDLPRWAAARAAPSLARLLVDAARWREAHALPRHVFVSTGIDPKPRYADLESPFSLEMVARLVAGLRPAERLDVVEMLPAPADLWLSDAAGRYACGFLVQMENRPA